MSSLLIASLLALGQAEETSASGLEVTVIRLVKQLDDDRLERREQAEAELIDLGPIALEYLPPSGRQMSPEVKSRLARVLAQLEREAVKAATRASTVTLKGTMPLSQALSELERQTGNRLADYRDRFGQAKSDPEVTLDFDQADYWKVVDHLLDQCELRLYSYSGEPHLLSVVGGSKGQLPAAGRVSHDGLFRFEATRVEAVRDLRNPTQESLKVSLEIIWEPRILPIALRQPLQSVSAVDKEGGELAPDNTQRVVEVPVQNTVGAVEMDLPFKLPDRSVRAIASIRGTLEALLPGRKVTYRFDDLEKTKHDPKRSAEVTVFLEAVRKNGPVYEVRMRVQFDDASGALESHRGWVFNNKAYLVDSAGNPVERAGFETTRQTPDEVGVSYKFVVERPISEYSFIYETPAAIVRLPVQYELTDIRLP